MSVGSPIMCAECGYLHGHHAVSCERHMTGAEAWREVVARVDAIVAKVHSRHRDRLRSRLLALAHERARSLVNTQLCDEFEQAMYEAGYNIR